MRLKKKEMAEFNIDKCSLSKKEKKEGKDWRLKLYNKAEERELTKTQTYLAFFLKKHHDE